jgi:hypothetical protein
MNKKNLKNTEANVKNNFTSHVDKKNIFDIFVDIILFPSQPVFALIP